MQRGEKQAVYFDELVFLPLAEGVRCRAGYAWRRLTGIEECAFVALPRNSGCSGDVGNRCQRNERGT